MFRLSKIKDVLGTIPLANDATPVAASARKIPLAYEEIVKERLVALEEKGIISRSTSVSAWQSPLVVVFKSSGEPRICVDLRAVNKSVIRQPYPFVSFEQLSARFTGATVFSKIDIVDAFHQIELAERDRHITTFMSTFGTFQYDRLAFGLANAPELFQRVMRHILEGLRNVESFMDDIIAYGKDQKEHDR